MKLREFKKNFKNRNFLRLWIAQVISSFGDGLWLIALPLLVFEITGNKIYVGVVSFVELVPLALGIFVAPLIDRYDKKKILLICDLGRGFVLLSLVFMYFNGLLNLYTISVSAFLLSLQSLFFIPSRITFVPKIVKKENLDQALSFMNMTELMALIIGKLLCGILMGMVSSGVIFLIDAISFFIASLLIMQIRGYKSHLEREENHNFIHELRDAFTQIKHNRDWNIIIRYFFLINVILAGLVQVIAPLLAIERFEKSYSIWFSMMYSFFQGGMLLGNLIVFLKSGTTYLLGLYPKVMIVFGVCMLVLSYPTRGFEPILFLLTGMVISYIDVKTILYFQKVLPEQYSGRIYTLIFSIVKMGEPLSAGLYTVLLIFLSASSITFFVGGVLVVSFVTLVMYRRRSTRKAADVDMDKVA